MSAIVVSSVSPDLWDTTELYPFLFAKEIAENVSVNVPIWLIFIKMEFAIPKFIPFCRSLVFVTNKSSPTNWIFDPNFLVNHKTTLLEHLTTSPQKSSDVKETLIEEYSKYDKDLRLLTFKILLEKFNDNYKNLLPEQKNILKEFITSVNSTKRLHKIVNEELDKISKLVINLSSKIKNDIVKIKLDEVSKAIKPISKKEKVTDTHLINLMQYYDLVNELKTL